MDEISYQQKTVCTKTMAEESLPLVLVKLSRVNLLPIALKEIKKKKNRKCKRWLVFPTAIPFPDLPLLEPTSHYRLRKCLSQTLLLLKKGIVFQPRRHSAKTAEGHQGKVFSVIIITLTTIINNNSRRKPITSLDQQTKEKAVNSSKWVHKSIIWISKELLLQTYVYSWRMLYRSKGCIYLSRHFPIKLCIK